METPGRSEEEAPPQKKARFSLSKCPNPSAAKKCSPNFARMVPAALAAPLPPPETIRARFETAGLPWMGIDIETHCLVPSTADSWWRPGQFGYSFYINPTGVMTPVCTVLKRGFFWFAASTLETLVATFRIVANRSFILDARSLCGHADCMCSSVLRVSGS